MSDWARVIDLASSDSKFRTKLKSDPASACREAGCPIASGSSVRVIEQKIGEVHFVLGLDGSKLPPKLLAQSLADTLEVFDALRWKQFQNALGTEQ